VSPEVKVIDGPQREVAEAAAEFVAGTIGIMDLVQRLDTIRRKAAELQVLRP
jgi:hypothetical protein